MGSFTDFLEHELLDHVFGDQAYTSSGTLHVGLSTTTITDAGGNDTEPVGDGYARVAIANDLTTWSDASAVGSGTKDNNIAITFPEATASWGTIIDFAIYDNPTAGNMIGYGTLLASQAVTSGNTLQFASGALDITLD